MMTTVLPRRLRIALPEIIQNSFLSVSTGGCELKNSVPDLTMVMQMWEISMPEIWAKSLIIAKSWHLFSVDRHTHVLVVNSMPLEKGDFCLTVTLHIIASQADESNFKGPSESLPATLP